MTDLQTSAPDPGHRALDTQVGTAGSGADQPRTHPSAAAAPKPLAGVSDPSSPPDTGQSGGDTHALGAVSGGDPTPPPASSLATPKARPRGVDSLLLIIADQLDDIETSRIAANNRWQALTTTSGDFGKGINPNLPEAQAVRRHADELERLEHQMTLTLQRVIRQHPLHGWIKRSRGVGEKQAARLLAAIGDPATRTNPSQLWAYCGLHVVNGQAPTRRRGEKGNWNDEARKRVWVIAEAAVKAGVRKSDDVDDSLFYDVNGRYALSDYGQVYLDAREKHADALHQHPCVRCGPKGHPAEPGTPLSRSHQQARAYRAVMKRILLDLWREARDQGGTR